MREKLRLVVYIVQALALGSAMATAYAAGAVTKKVKRRLNK